MKKCVEIRKCYLNTENCYSKYTTKHPQNLKPQKQNPFEFNPRPQNTNQIKHLEQTKEINNKKKKKKKQRCWDLGLRRTKRIDY